MTQLSPTCSDTWVHQKDRMVARHVILFLDYYQISNRSLAQMLSIPLKELDSYLKMETPFPASIVALMSAIFGVSANYFFEGTDDLESSCTFVNEHGHTRKIH